MPSPAIWTAAWGGSCCSVRASALRRRLRRSLPDQRSQHEHHDMIWVFTHEFKHALDARRTSSGRRPDQRSPRRVYNDMPYFGPIIDAGEHYDWEAQTMRLFTGFDTLAAPFNDYLEVDDPDGDRLASNDARVPMDEARFGSSATLADTDGDGLDDRAEYAAGRFASSNPTVADTDGDGQRDGVDPTPRAGIAASMTALTPAIDGVREAGYTLFRNGVEFSNVAGFTAATYIAYDANNVYILAEDSQSASLFINLDGSGANGFWQGDNTYAFSLTPGTTAAAQPHEPPRHQRGRRRPGRVGAVHADGRKHDHHRGPDPTGESRSGIRLDRGNTNGFSTSVGTRAGAADLYTALRRRR